MSLFLYAQTHYTVKEIDSLLVSNEKTNNWSLQKNIQFLDNLYKESQKIGYEKGMYASLLKINNWYMLKGQYKNAISYCEKIEKLPVKDPENNKYKIRSLQNKAFAYSNLGLYDDAQVAIDKSLATAERLNNDDVKFQLLGQGSDLKAALYIEMKMPEDSILGYFKKTVFLYRKIKKEEKRNNLLKAAYINISNSFFETKKLDSAMLYSYRVLAMKNIGDEAKASVFQIIGQIHREKHNLDSSFYYFKNAEKISVKLGDPLTLKSIYQNLYEMYEKSGDKDSALLYTKKYSYLSDSLIAGNKEGAAIANKNIKEELREENTSQQKRLYWIIGGIIILLFSILLICLYFFKNYNKEKKAQLEKNEIIEKKDIELQKLKSKVNESFEEVVTLAKNNDVAFLGRFKEVYPDFCNNIQQKCPDILNSELTFCAYLKLSFSTKEIATYTFTAAKSVQNRKNRLRKRLNIPSDEDIYIWINNI